MIVGGDDGEDGQGGPTVSLNPGWNGGAHSILSVPADWNGMISFDIPDVQGVRQGGIAVGLVPVSDLPTVGRNGYDHMDYGLVVTASYLRVIHAGEVVVDMPYVDVRAAREPDTDTDLVSALMYGAFVKWIMNGMTLWAGVFSMPEPYALDATLYLAYDAVDNPEFVEGAWGDLEDGSLNGVMAGFEMTADASSETSLVLPMQGFAAQFSDVVVWNLFGGMSGFGIEAGEGEGVSASMGAFSMIAADIANYSPLVGTMGPFSMTIGMGEPDGSVPYSVLSASMPYFGMSMTFPPTARLEAAMRGFEMRASSEASYSELRASMGGFRILAYGGEVTPLIEIVESIGTRMPVYQSVYIALMFIERVGGAVEAVGYATVTAEAINQISAQDTASYSATLLDAAMEMVGVGERLVVLARRNDGGSIAGEGEAWVVNTRSGASTRYDQYGFNSFATVNGKHYGARMDGVYLLSGADDAGAPITSGIALGQHDFGTQALKSMTAVYAGVSSTGVLFLKIGDGCREFTYRARRADNRMKTQRFDPGRGLRANYFTFDLTSDFDAFELDTVKFDVVASQRRI
ncbi:hypothetical protein [Aquabacterium commune]|uniref:hypothetical protein n=1 Tax=Aquabacterium commune TaxID=70586 RepID=UPI003BAE24C4